MPVGLLLTMQNKDKMELKEIAPYLAYGLWVVSPDGKSGDVASIGNLNSEGDEDLCNGWGTHHPIKLIKPILRPLSDLAKPCLEGGKIPIEETGYCSIEDCRGEDGVIDEFTTTHIFKYMPYRFVEKLFKWHFDVFGLIEKGEAIDINTINK